MSQRRGQENERLFSSYSLRRRRKQTAWMAASSSLSPSHNVLSTVETPEVDGIDGRARDSAHQILLDTQCASGGQHWRHGCRDWSSRKTNVRVTATICSTWHRGTSSRVTAPSTHLSASFPIAATSASTNQHLRDRGSVTKHLLTDAKSCSAYQHNDFTTRSKVRCHSALVRTTNVHFPRTRYGVVVNKLHGWRPLPP